jgi:FixJ family two-component response regulator
MAAAIPHLDLAPRPQGGGLQKRPRVCVVNDDGAVLISLKFLLATAGFEVRAFASGRGLLASPAMRRAQVFVLDHRPRGPDALDLARRLRRLGLSAPIVLTTGFRCGVLETVAGAFEPIYVTPRVDEALIQDLLQRVDDLRETP